MSAALDLRLELHAARRAEVLAKGAGDRKRAHAQKRVATRATALAVQVERLLRTYGLQRYREEKRRLLRGRAAFAKQLTRADLERELLDVLRRFGLAQMTDAGKRTGRGDFEIVPELWNEVQSARQTKVVLLIEETDAKIRESLDAIVGDALNETPRPTSSEIGRRIARSWFGPTLKTNPGRGTRAEDRMTADWRRRETGGLRPGEQEYLFSFDRAATIARTELASAENAGIVAGVQAAGFPRLRWNAAPDDGRSGRRRHYEMRGETVFVEAIVENDESGWFILPSGIRTPYPQWPGLPASEMVNCRCFGTGSE